MAETGARPRTVLSGRVLPDVNPWRLASVAAIVVGVTAGIIVLLELAFAGHVFSFSAELIATMAILAASGAIYAWLNARQRIENLREAERELAKARDEAEEANRTKSMFLATMSHEIRTPMNGVLGMLRLLTETRLDQEQDSYARAARHSGEVLLSLIDEILDFSKIEAGRLDLNIAPFDLSQLAENVAELLAPRAHAKGITVSCYVDPRLAGSYSGDVARLRQILLNLAGNAVKFTDTGGVTLTVRPAPADVTGDAVRFSIADTGIGMNPEDLDAIFDEFRQADSRRSRRHGGTGLGLAITRRLVERMEGTISVTSSPGEGSRFDVDLALEPVGVKSPSANGILAGLSIDLVGLDEITRDTAMSYLGDFGATVASARDAEEAIKALRLAPACPDIMVVDAGLGIEEALSVPNLVREFCDVPPPRLAVLLAPEDRKALPQLKDAGYDGYLIKPLRRKSLVERLAAMGAVHGEDAADLMTSPDYDHEFDVPHVEPLNVLLAEDNKVNAMLSRSVLEKAGHRVQVAANGDEAVETHFAAPPERPFDVILMDVHMPDVDGLEAARRIRSREAAGCRVPIIALTANAFEEDRQECLASGMDDYLSKPFEPEDMARALYRHCIARPL